MLPLTDLVTAQNLVDFYQGAQPEDSENIGDRLFPARKQLGLQLDFIKGANNQPVVLKASAFDTQATLRDRMSVKISSEDMPFFREGMKIKEADRQQLNLLGANANPQIVEVIVDNLYNDQTTLIEAAKARVHAMRMQVLATGKLAVDSNGVKREYDYGVEDTNKAQAEVDWSEDTADPLKDIDNALEQANDIGVQPAGIILNSKTFGQIRNKDATSRAVNGAKNKPATRRELLDFLQDEYQLNVELVNDTYIDDDKKSVKYYPDGYVTFVPNQAVGSTVFGTTPEESDLQGGINNVDVSIVETGVAVTTEVTNNPVNVDTNVSMINLPSFEGANLVFQLQTDLSADEPADGEDDGTGDEGEAGTGE